MNYRLLVTGQDTATIDLFYAQMSEDYQCITTSTRYADMKAHMEIFQPDLFVFCMDGESDEVFARMKELKKELGFANTGFAVIGAAESVTAFQSGTDMMADIALMSPIPKAAIKRTFDSYLVEHAVPREGGSLASGAQGEAGGSTRKNVLIIDDDPMMLKLIKSHLRDDYDIAAAKGGQMAYDFLAKKHTDLILLDYEMPGEDGPTVFRKIRQMPKYQSTPIVFLTGVADADRISKVAALRPQGYLLKPIVADKLISKVKELLG